MEFPGEDRGNLRYPAQQAESHTKSPAVGLQGTAPFRMADPEPL